MALGHRSLNRRSVEARRCKACGRGMAMVNNPNGGRYCRWCGFDPTEDDAPFEVREARVIDALSEHLGLSEDRLVVAMTTRKLHRQGCRYVVSPGSAAFPFADDGAVRLLPRCGMCKP